MYLINIDKLTDKNILKNIYTNIDCFGLKNQVFIIYNIDVKKDIFKYKDIIFHCVLVNFDELAELEEDELEDKILDLIEFNTNVLFTKPKNTSKEKIDLILEIAEEFGLKFNWYGEFDFEKEVDLSNLTFNEVQIIKELFEVKTDVEGFMAGYFMLKFRIDEKGIVYDIKNNKVLDLNKEEFINIIFVKPEGIEDVIKRYIEDYRNSKLLNLKFYEPFALLSNDIDINKKIIEYKYKVFDKIKNLHPDNYPKVPLEVIKIFNENGYIQLKDIIEILEEFENKNN